MVARKTSPTWGTMRTERSMVAIKSGRDANWMDNHPAPVPDAVPTPAPPTPARDLPDDELKARVNTGDKDARRELARRLREGPEWVELTGQAHTDRVTGLLGPTMVGRARYVYARGDHTLIAEVPLTKAQLQGLLEDAAWVLDESRPMLEGKGVLIRVPAKDPHFRGTKRITLGYVRQGVNTIHLNPKHAKGGIAESVQAAKDSGHFMEASKLASDVRYTLAHEMGHVIDFLHHHTQQASTRTPSGFEIAGPKDPEALKFWMAAKAALSKYGTSSVHEGYAEAFADWLLGQGRETLDYWKEYQWHKTHDH